VEASGDVALAAEYALALNMDDLSFHNSYIGMRQSFGRAPQLHSSKSTEDHLKSGILILPFYCPFLLIGRLLCIPN
jgi:hypothetical protein